MKKLFLANLLALTTTYTSLMTLDTIPLFEKGIYEWSKTMGETFHLINTKYYQHVDPQKPMINAISAFLKTLDPHSSFMDATSFEQIKRTTQGEFGGIGIHIDNTKEPDEEFLRVIETIAAGPADKAGLKANDKIVEIDNKSLKGMTIDEAVALLMGERGTIVHVKVLREDTIRLLPFDITRDTVKEQNALCYYFKDHDIYYLSLNLFTENSVNQIEQLLKKCQESNAKGIILDLRNNSGGLLSAVIDIAGLFLEKGSLIVETKDKKNAVMDRYVTTKAPISNKKIPLFIIVNNYTASAAEILAGCLQLYSEKGQLSAYVVGSKTFGKGSVQEIIPISNDCALRLTIALYALPNNVLLQGTGITPDFTLEQRYPPCQEVNWFNNFFGRESHLKNSITLESKNKKSDKKNEPTKEKSWHEKKQELIASDYMILSTIRLIEMLNLGQKAYPSALKTRANIITFLEKTYSPKDTSTLEEIKV